MNALATSTLTTKALRHSAVAQVRSLENGNDSKSLDDGGPQFERRRFESPAAGHQLQSSHSETGSSAPLWNGPRLRPAFVAQVIGQVTMNHREQAARLARVAYNSTASQVPAALLLDNRI